MNIIKMCTSVIIMSMFIIGISVAQDYVTEPKVVRIKPPKAPKIIGLSKLDEQDEKELLNKLSPELKAELLKVKEYDQQKFEELLRETSYGRFEFYTDFMEPKEKERMENERKIEEMEVKTEALGIRYEYASSTEKQKIVSELKAVLNKLFDMKEKARSLEVEMLERELTQLKESLKVRKQSKDEIINRRLNELIGKGDYLDW
ncbi:hypothetical protein LJE86_01545 [bacterium BMS3Abin03]|nr:hypothetical protein [bacterium BMS3Abin03]MCG6960737.1 hypothetical protein [bacterium BMS3Abin03]